MGVFGGARSPDLQGLYKVRGLHKDLGQAREPPAPSSSSSSELVPRFGVEVKDERAEELADVSRGGVVLLLLLLLLLFIL